MSVDLKKFFNLDDVTFTQEELEAPYENASLDFYEKPYNPLTKPNIKSVKYINDKKQDDIKE